MKHIKIVSILSLVFLCPAISAAAQKPKPMCHPCTPFEEKTIALVKSDLFYASMDPRDSRVPRVFVQPHEHIASLADWREEHWQEFGKFEKMLELGLRKAFGAELVNVACLMNLAGEEGTHTHWHFIARLPEPITIIDPATKEEHELKDPCYGKPYDMNGKNYRPASDIMLKIIIKKIQSNLDLTILPGSQLKDVDDEKRDV